MSTRDALWIPQSRTFIRKHFGEECVGQTFASVHQTPTVHLFRTEIQRKRLNIVSGKTGCGKTLCARIRMAAGIRANGHIGHYLRATDLSLQLGRGGYLSHEKEQLLTALRQTPWVVLDDLGAEHRSERFVEVFFHLVDMWATRGITAIFITNNDPPKEWPDRYGFRAWSRIVKWAGSEILRTADPDFRIHPELLKQYPIPEVA